MTIKARVIQFLESIVEKLRGQNKIEDYNKTLHNASTYTRVNKKAYEELESMFFELNTKVTILSNEVMQLNEKIAALTILQEELLYSFDKVEQTEENPPKLKIHTEKKYEVN